jgi:hypothetical protein
MKKRIVLLTTLAALLAAAMALSGVAQAKPTATSADRQCMKLAIQTLPNFNPTHYTFHGGDTNDSQLSDDFTGQGDLTDGPDVFCGFSGPDSIDTLNAGDIFLGGADDDAVISNYGTFYGQEGPDGDGFNYGTFYGGAGDDAVQDNYGTFDGGDGFDVVVQSEPGSTAINVEPNP